MLILHCTRRSLVRHTPSRIACYWGRYTEHKSVGICLNRPGGFGIFKESLNPYGTFYAQGHKGMLKDLVSDADVIHCHDDAYPTQLTRDASKKLIYHAHIGDIPRRLFRSNKVKYFKHVKHACITNGYGRCFNKEEERSKVKWGRLPDILDLDHPIYRPDYGMRTDPSKLVKVVFTFSNSREPGTKINAKAPIATKTAILGNPKGKIPGVEVRFISGVAFDAGMHWKRLSHIVLDEIFSPYTHLSALEGAAVGACVLTSYDDFTVRELCDFVGAPYDSYPFVQVTPQNVRQKIEYFRDHPDEMTEIGRASRAWMEKYYHHKLLLKKYLEFYMS